MNKKNEIIEAAGQLFSEKGYDLSMSDIAGKVGIKTPSLYSHFESKDEIIGLVLEKEIADLYVFLNRTIDQLEAASTELKLKQLFLSIFEHFDKSGQLEILKRVPFIDNEAVKEKFTRIMIEKDADFSAKLKGLIREGIDTGELKKSVDEGTMLLYLTSIQGLLDIKLIRKYSASQMEQYTLTAWTTFWNLIKA